MVESRSATKVVARVTRRVSWTPRTSRCGSHAKSCRIGKGSRATLAQWACHGKGPRYARLGRHCRYRLSDVSHGRRNSSSAVQLDRPSGRIAENPERCNRVAFAERPDRRCQGRVGRVGRIVWDPPTSEASLGPPRWAAGLGGIVAVGCWLRSGPSLPSDDRGVAARLGAGQDRLGRPGWRSWLRR